MNKWMNKQYGEPISSPGKLKNDYIAIGSPLLTADTKASTGDKHSKVLPLLFYWKFDYLVSCVLNTNIPLNTFSSTVLPYANSKGLKQKLNGQKIELTVTNLPNAFSLKDKGHIIWLILYAVNWHKTGLVPENKNLVVSYKILNGSEITKTGQVSVPDTNQPLQLRFMQSPKKATGHYLEQYDENMRLMSKKIVDAIMAEL